MNNLSGTSALLKQDEIQLKNLTEKHPWCSLAQLSLLYKYKKNNPVNFENQSTKTTLFFKSSAWLNWQLHLLSKEEIIEEEKPGSEKTITNQEENIAHEQKINTEKSVSNTSSQQNNNEEIIAFEPLHTRDYFASQGIKITEETTSNDKLSNQMKSFTEWLKSMKKIHKESLPAGDEQTDKNIQHLAEQSNANAEVVTEAMAEILLKQNKNEKAIEVYEKLSLLNPSKSGYFAAKIDTLKN